MSRDETTHYPADPILFGVLPGLYKTSSTMCGKRRDIERITDDPALITCPECGSLARDYWTEQKVMCESLIRYAETEPKFRMAGNVDPIPRLRAAMGEAIHILAQLPPVSREEW